MARKNRGYASGTRVTVEQSQMEIMRLLRKEGADQSYFGEKRDRAFVGFTAHNRQIKMSVVLPHNRTRGRFSDGGEGEVKRRWRALLFSLKAKFEAARSEISTFEVEFQAHTVMPNGMTVSELVGPLIEDAYKTGKMPPLMLLGAMPDREDSNHGNEQ